MTVRANKVIGYVIIAVSLGSFLLAICTSNDDSAVPPCADTIYNTFSRAIAAYTAIIFILSFVIVTCQFAFIQALYVVVVVFFVSAWYYAAFSGAYIMCASATMEAQFVLSIVCLALILAYTVIISQQAVTAVSDASKGITTVDDGNDNTSSPIVAPNPRPATATAHSLLQQHSYDW